MAHWNWRQRSIAVALWPSFLAACLGTLLFFAKLDATRLQQAFVFDFQLSDQAVYSIGFLFFWLVAFTSSVLSTWLIRTERRIDDFPTLDDDNRR
ncbi:MAG: hypothetical protein AB8G16_04710 [Gammaproteobacteria bacterium]